MPACILSQLAADLEAIHARQAKIENDGVEFVDHGQVQAGHAVAGEIDHMTAVSEEHTSLGPKSYCPDYRNLPVTLPKLRSVEQNLQWAEL